MTTLKILACQINVPVIQTAAQRDQHLENTAAKIRSELVNSKHDLVVLPELSSIDYSLNAFDNLDVLAESLSGPSYQLYSQLAVEFGVCIVYGIARKENGHCFITQVAVGADGELVGFFDKLHIANFGFSTEKKYFSRGNHLFVFQCKGITIAPIICYDIRIPELTRVLALKHKVQLILHCGAYGRDQSFYSWHDFVVTRALENQLYILSLNRAGKKFGHSFFCPPWIDEQNPGIKLPQFNESLVSLSVELKIIKEIRKQYSFLADKFEDYDQL